MDPLINDPQQILDAMAELQDAMQSYHLRMLRGVRHWNESLIGENTHKMVPDNFAQSDAIRRTNAVAPLCPLSTFCDTNAGDFPPFESQFTGRYQAASGVAIVLDRPLWNASNALAPPSLPLVAVMAHAWSLLIGFREVTFSAIVDGRQRD